MRLLVLDAESNHITSHENREHLVGASTQRHSPFGALHFISILSQLAQQMQAQQSQIADSFPFRHYWHILISHYSKSICCRQYHYWLLVWRLVCKHTIKRAVGWWMWNHQFWPICEFIARSIINYKMHKIFWKNLSLEDNIMSISLYG